MRYPRGDGDDDDQSHQCTKRACMDGIATQSCRNEGKTYCPLMNLLLCHDTPRV